MAGKKPQPPLSDSKGDSKESKKSKISLFAQLKDTFSATYWAFKMMYKIAPWDVVFLFVIAVLLAVLPTAKSYIYAKWMDELIKLAGSGTTLLANFTWASRIFQLYVISTVLGLIKGFVKRTDRFLQRKFDKLHFARIEDQYYEKLSLLDLQHYEDKDISNLLVKCSNNIWRIRETVRTVREFTVQVISVIVAGVFCFKISPLIAVFTIIAAIPDSVVYYKFMKKLNKFWDERMEDMRRRGWLRGAYSSESQLIENKITKAARYLHEKASALNLFLTGEEVAIFKQRFGAENSVSIFNTFAWMVSELFLLSKVFAGQLSVGNFGFYSGRFGDFGGYLGGFAGYVNDLIDSAYYIKSIRELFELKPKVVSGTLPLKNGVEVLPRIEFRDVWFRYPGTKKYVLKNINFVIEPRDEIALVGHNGAGKTTLLNLVLRFYDPTKGEILIDGVNLKDLNLDEYYALISNLAQNFNAYGVLDAKSNIGIGRPLEEFDMDRIRDAAIKGDADEFIQGFDKKYDQILNKNFTDGTKLSGGQWQRLALSRMFYRNTPILILDEPTSAIDAESEYKIFQRIYDFIHDKTVIIVSHRFSTVRNAKKIYVLADGEIAERGSHEDLMKLNGKYAQAFNIQAQGYNGSGEDNGNNEGNE